MGQEATEYLIQHGYTVLFLWVLLDQIGVPLPGTPLLLAAGALAGMGELDLPSTLALSATAAFLADQVWYEASRRRGTYTLGLVCRISLEPGTCVRRTQSFFRLYGRWTMVVSKFIPGLNGVAVCLSGVVGMPRLRFMAFSALASMVWTGTGIGVGYSFSEELAGIFHRAVALGNGALLVLFAGLTGLTLFKYLRRRSFLGRLRRSRISPEELKGRLDGGEDLVIVDLRAPLEFNVEPRTLPKAIRMAPSELEERYREIPAGREVVVYCSCPDEATSADLAVRLERHGIGRIRPLAGGFEAWKKRGYPLALPADHRVSRHTSSGRA